VLPLLRSVGCLLARSSFSCHSHHWCLSSADVIQERRRSHKVACRLRLRLRLLQTCWLRAAGCGRRAAGWAMPAHHLLSVSVSFLFIIINAPAALPMLGHTVDVDARRYFVLHCSSTPASLQDWLCSALPMRAHRPIAASDEVERWDVGWHASTARRLEARGWNSMCATSPRPSLSSLRLPPSTLHSSSLLP
jgi:hypothetical protein